MALHSSLPIYKVTYELLTLAGRITQHLPRNARAMGSKINDECLELVILIYRANSAANKVPHLDELLERLQVAELLFRLLTQGAPKMTATAKQARLSSRPRSANRRVDGGAPATKRELRRRSTSILWPKDQELRVAHLVEVQRLCPVCEDAACETKSAECGK